MYSVSQQVFVCENKTQIIQPNIFLYHISGLLTAWDRPVTLNTNTSVHTHAFPFVSPLNSFLTVQYKMGACIFAGWHISLSVYIQWSHAYMHHVTSYPRATLAATEFFIIDLMWFPCLAVPLPCQLSLHHSLFRPRGLTGREPSPPLRLLSPSMPQRNLSLSSTHPAPRTITPPRGLSAS